MSPADKIAFAVVLVVLAIALFGEGIFTFVDRMQPRRRRNK